MLNDFRDRLFISRLFRDEKWNMVLFLIVGFLMVGILVNLIYLNKQLLKNNDNSKTSIIYVNKNNTSPTPIVTLLPTPTLLPTIAITNNSAKDYYISLGSGSTQATSWMDIPGVAAQINFSNYTDIKEIHFEASLLTPSANQSVSVQLLNETDGHPVWYYNMTMSSGQTSQYLISNPLSYDLGSKLYQVQMQTQLGAPATLVQARIHIILK